jgi:hypothetical protein
MIRPREQPSNNQFEPLAESSPAYCLQWRPFPRQPWRREVFSHRFEAHDCYLSLVARGIEARLEMCASSGEAEWQA